jgi:hypothetical protein
MKDMPAFSRLAGRAPQLPTWRTYFCANPNRRPDKPPADSLAPRRRGHRQLGHFENPFAMGDGGAGADDLIPLDGEKYLPVSGNDGFPGSIQVPVVGRFSQGEMVEPLPIQLPECRCIAIFKGDDFHLLLVKKFVF